MPRQVTDHDDIIAAIRNSGVLSELVEEHHGHFIHELDLEVIVYGRTYGEKQVGPYLRLLVYSSGEEIIRQGQWKRNAFYVLLSRSLDVYAHDAEGVSRKLHELESQNIFGEMSVLAGRPSTATVKVPNDQEAVVLEIERPALRLLRKLTSFGKRLDYLYSRHGLSDAVHDIKKGGGGAFTDELLEKLREHSSFVVYTKDHLLLRQGDRVNKLIFIKNGWICRELITSTENGAPNPTAELIRTDRTEKIEPDIAWDFLGPGNWIGWEAMRGEANWQFSATVMGRTEVLEIPISKLRSDPVLLKVMLEYAPQFSPADDHPPQTPANPRTTKAAAKEIATGLVDASNLLVMDMDRCIRCGNCSLACHKVHGRSRLLRHGIHVARPVRPDRRSTQHVLVPNVCIHCQNPECLIGCPTGAIGRFEMGQIDISEKKCIGCGECATQCPYDAITMIPRKAPAPPSSSLSNVLIGWLTLAPPATPAPVTETSDMLAVKCNLCQNTPLNPNGKSQKPAYSCEENCPTGALLRVNPLEYFSEAKNQIGLVFKSRTHAIGRNIHQRDVPALIIHALAALAIFSITWAVLRAASHYTLDGHFEGTWLTMRWFTGLMGLGSIAIVLTYPIRKQFYKRRLGPLRYWKMVHAYLGLFAGIVLLIHGGRDSGGLLTSMLMVSFDVAIVSGLFGITCYFVVPRIMTSIEGDPLLIEDLTTRRNELRETLGLIDTSDDRLRQLVKVKMRRRFFSFGYLLRQYIKREDFETMLNAAREEFRADADTLPSQELRDSLMSAVETTATLRRVDSLIYLHQLLKLWLAPHVVSVSIMLALLCVHIIQVSLFTVR